ncbi:helix-turn-helix domain-containing protein [Labrys sp. La1]|uniref:helix-turn-helix domain-containing protein n=1 Tax=Labrys sp. La1 TaxID=3404917 RepID=UPI003EB8F675
MTDDLTTDEMKLVRQLNGLTQQEAADLMGVSLRTYHGLEAGTQPIRKLHSNAFRWALIHDRLMRETVEEACLEMANSFAQDTRLVAHIN